MATTALALDAVKKKGKGVVYMLNELIDGRTIQTSKGEFDVDNFRQEWSNGGKDLIERYWRDGANRPTGNFAPTKDYRKQDPLADDWDRDEYYEREFRQGKHEWIPTDTLDYLLGAAFHYKDASWLYLAEGLRIPTRLVVVFPGKVGADHYPLTGHVGALFLPNETNTEYQQITKGQAAFHNVLREILKQHLSTTTNNRKAYEDAFFKHLAEYYWQGNGYPGTIKASSPCHYFFNSGAGQYESWGLTMLDMAQKLKEGWENWKATMRNIFRTSDHLR